jgi:hypothetical protein
MTGEPLNRLDPDIAQLLRAAEPYPAAPRGVQARVATALASRIAALDASGPDDGSASGGGASGGASAIATPKMSGFVALAARPLRTIVGTFVVGAAVGAALHAVVAPPRERIVFVEKPAPASHVQPPSDERRAPSPAQTGFDLPAPAVPTAFTPQPSASPAAAPLPSARRSPASSEKPDQTEKLARGASDLGAEQALLDTARRALARGLTDEALAPLERHAQRYPEGVLAEERDALAVNVLVSLGRYPDARARGDRFFQRYPGSLLRGSVEAALGAIPK